MILSSVSAGSIAVLLPGLGGTCVKGSSIWVGLAGMMIVSCSRLTLTPFGVTLIQKMVVLGLG